MEAKWNYANEARVFLEGSLAVLTAIFAVFVCAYIDREMSPETLATIDAWIEATRPVVNQPSLLGLPVAAIALLFLILAKRK